MVEARASNPLLKSIRENFLLALDPTIRSQMGDVGIAQADALIKKAYNIWQASAGTSHAPNVNPFNIADVSKRYTPREVNESDPTQEKILQAIKDLSDGMKRLGQQTGPSISTRAEQRRPRTLTCFYCSKPGHMVRNCRTRIEDEKSGRKQSKDKRDEELEKLRMHVEELQAAAILKDAVKE